MVYSNSYLDIRNSYYNKAARNVNECDKGFLLILHIIARPVNDCLIGIANVAPKSPELACLRSFCLIC